MRLKKYNYYWNNTYEDDFNSWFHSWISLSPQSFEPQQAIHAFKINVYSDGRSRKIYAELPGFLKDEIDVSTKNQLLEISAKNEKNGVFQRELRVGDVNEKEITAQYTNGILTIELPNKEIPKSKQISIK